MLIADLEALFDRIEDISCCPQHKEEDDIAIAALLKVKPAILTALRAAEAFAKLDIDEQDIVWFTSYHKFCDALAALGEGPREGKSE